MIKKRIQYFGKWILMEKGQKFHICNSVVWKNKLINYNKILILILELQGMFIMERIKNQNRSFAQESDQISESHSHQHIQNQNIAISLQNSRTKFIEFVQDLGQYKSTQIRSDVFNHCEQINKNRKIISLFNSHETILKLISSRIDKMLKNKKIKKNWSQQDIKILVWIVSKYADRHGITNIEKQLTYEDWSNITNLIPGVTRNNCMYKWLSLKKVNLSTKNWGEQESKLLNKIINQNFRICTGKNILNGSNWREISQKLYEENKYKNKVYRSPKQCKEHWNCFLNPKLKKGPWQIQEDILLLNLIKKNNGLKRWSEIVESFSGRTENALKNRYNLLLEKQKKLNKNKNQMSLIADALQHYQTMNKVNQHRPIDQENQNLGPEENEIIKIKNENENESDQFYQEIQNSDHKKSQSHSIQSSCYSNTASQQLNVSGISAKIRFLSSSEQLQFLSWMKERTDVKKCCLKNGAFQIEE